MSDLGRDDMDPRIPPVVEVKARDLSEGSMEYVVHLNDASLEAIRRIVREELDR